MCDKINLNAIEGHRDKLEFQISYAQFTIFDQKKFDEIHSKLAPRDRLSLVSDNSKKLLSIHCYQAVPRNCLNSKVEA